MRKRTTNLNSTEKIAIIYYVTHAKEGGYE